MNLFFAFIVEPLNKSNVPQPFIWKNLKIGQIVLYKVYFCHFFFFSYKTCIRTCTHDVGLANELSMQIAASSALTLGSWVMSFSFN